LLGHRGRWHAHGSKEVAAENVGFDDLRAFPLAFALKMKDVGLKLLDCGPV
jgi:hypothetical protein